MAQSGTNDDIVPEISYDNDGVSTIRISTVDRKGHILRNQPGSVQYNKPQAGYVNAGYVNNNNTEPSNNRNFPKHGTRGEIIEPVLVRNKPEGEEIVHVRPAYDYRQHHPAIVPQETDIYRPENHARNSGTHRNSADSDTSSIVSTGGGSILKKSGENKKRRHIQQRRISWNENVKIRESDDKNKVTVAELQEIDHEYNPIDNPREEAYHRLIPPEPVLETIEESGDSVDALPDETLTETTPLPRPESRPNGDIQAIHEEPPPSPRHVHPYAAEHFAERERHYSSDQDNNKWCMRVTICILIFLLTFAIIGVIVLGLLYAWSIRIDWSSDRDDLKLKLSLLNPEVDNSSLNIFPKAWYSFQEGAPAFFLVTGSDSFENQRPNSQRYMTWHSGKAMKVTTGSDSFLLGDPLETDGAVFSLLLTNQNTYSARIEDGDEYSLVSFTATGGADMAWTQGKR